jgi:hypothetical protein
MSNDKIQKDVSAFATSQAEENESKSKDDPVKWKYARGSAVQFIAVYDYV